VEKLCTLNDMAFDTDEDRCCYILATK
jgi:hypothetical protein